MSKIAIQCDRCMRQQIIPVRQNHEARRILEGAGWSSRDTSSRFGSLKEDFCPDCVGSCW